jgi:hypothetical protein
MSRSHFFTFREKNASHGSQAARGAQLETRNNHYARAHTRHPHHERAAPVHHTRTRAKENALPFRPFRSRQGAPAAELTPGERKQTDNTHAHTLDPARTQDTQNEGVRRRRTKTTEPQTEISTAGQPNRSTAKRRSTVEPEHSQTPERSQTPGHSRDER